jgi:Omp85 superfamily domain/WD40-like Beta Propeller Repeat
LALVVACVWLVVPGRARAASDPYLEWWTMETAHFRIHYYKGLEPIAERIAAIAEAANARLTDAVGWEMSQPTEIVLSDDTDDANGSATALPYNTIRLYVTAPDDLSVLGDYDDFYLSIVTHEHTHILHTDNITGIPALVNSIIGKTLAPNQTQPRWILEGLAVREESRFTGGGRDRSSLFDMYLRANVIEDRIVPLDQMSHYIRQWPQGNIAYLYGSRFFHFIASVYGDDVFREMAADYGRQVMPWAINRSIRRVTGRTYEELYAGWVAYLRDHYASQLAEIRARGMREGVRLTSHGQLVHYPRFVPRAVATTGARYELLYYREDGHSPGGYYRLGFDSPRAGRRPDDDLVVRASSLGSAAFAPDGSVMFAMTAITKRVYPYSDLFDLPSRSEDPSGFSAERRRLTVGERAQYPDISPDGRRVVFTKNHRGTTRLVIADRTADGTLTNLRALAAGERYDQVYTPRFSPDGREVVYSAWSKGGYRDIRTVEVGTGQVAPITRDRAMDWEPCFSRDGRTIFFASDRAASIPNVFAFDRDTGKLWQVTNVRTGAFQPAVSPDGRMLVYVGYTSDGFDLFALPIDRATWTEPPPYVEARPDPPPVPENVVIDRHRYNPLGTLMPRSLKFDYGPGTWGTSVAISAMGSDVVGHHTVSGLVLIETESDPYLALGYVYGRLPFDMWLSLHRTLVPIKYSADAPVFTQQRLGVTSGLSYALRSPFDAQVFNFAYSFARFDGPIQLAPSPDPYTLLHGDPPRGSLGSVHLGWAYSSAYGLLYTVGPAERGFTLGLGVDVASRAIASDYSLYQVRATATGYVPMPWARHHTTALHVEGGVGGGDYPYRGLFYTGGFTDTPIIDAYTRGAIQGGFVLRGYPPVVETGNEYLLFNAEYRFPIATIDHGLSTLPFFVNRINGNLFADYGGAFYDLPIENWGDVLHLGVGAELWIELTLGYFVSGNIRIGHAKGIGDSRAIPGGQTYIVVSAPY